MFSCVNLHRFQSESLLTNMVRLHLHFIEKVRLKKREIGLTLSLITKKIKEKLF